MSDLAMSTGDMLSGIDAGTLSSFSESPTAVDDGAATNAAGISTGESEGAEPDFVEASPESPEDQESQQESPVDESAAADAQPEEEAASREKPAQDLPDGVRAGKDRNGKDGYFVTPERWKTVYDNGYKTAQAISEIIGEPLSVVTADDGTSSVPAIDLRNRAYMAEERLYNDLISGVSGQAQDGSATGQAGVINYIFDQAARALQDGEVGADPMTPFAQTFYGTLKARNPEAYAHVRQLAAQDLLNEMYEEAGTGQSRNLWLSTGWIAKQLGIPVRPEAQMQEYANRVADPSAQLRQQVEQLTQQLNSRAGNDAAVQFNTVKNQARQNIQNSVLEDGVKGSLSDDQLAAWQKFPTQLDQLVIQPLHQKVIEAIKKDQKFNERIAMMDQAAQRATSQKRGEIFAQIQQAFVNRARLAADALKVPILKEAAAKFEEANKANHQRRQAAQNQRGPTGPQNAPPRSLVPQQVVGQNGSNVATRDSMQKDIERVFSSL